MAQFVENWNFRLASVVSEFKPCKGILPNNLILAIKAVNVKFLNHYAIFLHIRSEQSQSDEEA